MRKRPILAVLLVFSLCAAMVMPAGAASEHMSPNAAEIEVIESQRPLLERTEMLEPKVASDGTVYRLGALSDGFIAPELRGEWASPAMFASVPSSYDMRNYNYMTSVKNQNPYGDCWAFATIGPIESNIRKKNGVTADLSELHVVYFASVRDSAVASAGGGTAGDIVSSRLNLLNAGGNGEMSMNALANWLGAAPESTLSQANSSHRSMVSNRAVSSSLAYAPDTYHLKNAYCINSRTNPEAVKSMIMTCGAAYMSFKWDDQYYNSSYYSYYDPSNSYTSAAGGHAVTVCGWNDNFSKYNFNNTASRNGAWLCKNSWGPNWGDDGYFWMSYDCYSMNAGGRTNVYFFDVEPTSSNEHLYQYDGGNYSYSFSLGSPTYGANIFTADRSESVKSVSFYTENTSLTVSVYVYTDVTEGNPSSGTLAGSKIGVSVPYTGYHTIDLPEAVSVEKGKKFSVVICLSDSNGSSPWMVYDRYFDGDDESSKVVSYAGQSFYGFDGNYWLDCDTEYGNLRIKAVTTSLVPTYIRGDANYDHYVTVKDAIMVARVAAKLKTLDETQQLHADANNDGNVNVTDVLYIKKAVAELITLPPY